MLIQQYDSHQDPKTKQAIYRRLSAEISQWGYDISLSAMPHGYLLSVINNKTESKESFYPRDILEAINFLNAISWVLKSVKG